jgi:hypothetical protein
MVEGVLFLVQGSRSVYGRKARPPSFSSAIMKLLLLETVMVPSSLSASSLLLPPLVHQAGGNDQIGAVFDDLTDSVVAVILTVIGFFLAGMYVGLYCTMDECSPILLKMD